MLTPPSFDTKHAIEIQECLSKKIVSTLHYEYHQSFKHVLHTYIRLGVQNNQVKYSKIDEL